MKKVSLILLVCIYAISSFGFSLKEFYCCGKLKSITVSLSGEGKEKCGMGGEADGCCKTKFQFCKLKDNHLNSSDISAPVKQFTALPVVETSLDVSFTPVGLKIIDGTHAPPPDVGVLVYIFNCNFRI